MTGRGTRSRRRAAPTCCAPRTPPGTPPTCPSTTTGYAAAGGSTCAAPPSATNCTSPPASSDSAASRCSPCTGSAVPRRRPPDRSTPRTSTPSATRTACTWRTSTAGSSGAPARATAAWSAPRRPTSTTGTCRSCPRSTHRGTPAAGPAGALTFLEHGDRRPAARARRRVRGRPVEGPQRRRTALLRRLLLDHRPGTAVPVAFPGPRRPVLPGPCGRRPATVLPRQRRRRQPLTAAVRLWERPGDGEAVDVVLRDRDTGRVLAVCSLQLEGEQDR